MSGPVENSGIRDAGLRCPRCDYNLTGLPEPRCPECGTAFDWEELRHPKPAIAFERARGWRKVPAFVVTWATVLFAPWTFARQTARRVSVAHGIAFLAVCYAAVSIALPIDPGFFPFWAAWLSTTTIYIVLQAVGLTIIDPHGWRAPLLTLRFWLLVGCYTSAVMITECYGGPPQFGVSDLWERMLKFCRGQLELSDVYGLMDRDTPWWWAQLILWLAAVVCCYAARLHRRRVVGVLIALMAVVAALGLFTLYAFCVEQIGYRLWDLYGGSFW